MPARIVETTAYQPVLVTESIQTTDPMTGAVITAKRTTTGFIAHSWHDDQHRLIHDVYNHGGLLYARGVKESELVRL